jgi:NTP pyrophosphatase (non-canonical NTP hydrolase)
METVEAVAEVNAYTINQLNYIRDNIESMNKFNQIEVLRILSKHDNITLNENKYGVHVNLSELKKEFLDELNVYIKYVNAQEITLNAFEQQKEDYKNTYFSKDIKDISKVLNK